MTVSSTTNRKSFAGDGVTTSFGTSPVVFFNSSELVVQVVVTATGAATTLAEGTNYTVTGGNGAVGTVNLAGGTSPNGAPSALQTLLIRRVLPLTQADDFVNNDINDAEVTERRFDKTVMQIQQLGEEIGRGLVIPASETATAALTTLPFDRASKFLAFDASKNPIASEGTVPGAVPVSTFMATVLDDTSQAAARATLGAAGSGAVTSSGLTMATARLLGRTTAGSGAVEEITVGSGLTLSGGALTSTVAALTLGTQQNTTSGTSIDFTGIPSSVNRITAMFNGISTNGTSNYQLQIGSGSVVTAGYTSYCANVDGTNATSVATSTSAYLLKAGGISAASVGSGVAVLTRINGNTWVCSSSFNLGTGVNSVQNGVLALGAPLTVCASRRPAALTRSTPAP